MYEYLFSVNLDVFGETDCKAILLTNSIDPDDWEVESFYRLVECESIGDIWALVDKTHKYYQVIKEKFESLDEWHINYEWDHYRD